MNGGMKMDITYLKNDHLGCYNGMAFDGSNFYATAQDFIYKLDKNMTITAKIQTFRTYNQICFDNVDGCFYALCLSSPHKIFKLDLNLNEVDFILLPHYVLSICFFENKIFYANSNRIFSINKLSNTDLVAKFNIKMPVSIYFFEQGFLACSLNKEQYFLELYDNQNKLISTKKLPKGYTPNQIVSKNTLLASKSGIYSYFL